MNIAPSYVAAVVSILMGLQSLLGLDFTTEQWTGAIVVISGLIIAIRQYVTGRSTAFGARPKGFQ